jgi:cell division protein ZapB
MPTMAKSEPSRESQADIDLKKLDFRIDELIRIVERLKEENLSLQQKQETLVSERAALMQKNDLVRTRVEAMITRLRAMEHGQ